MKHLFETLQLRTARARKNSSDTIHIRVALEHACGRFWGAQSTAIIRDSDCSVKSGVLCVSVKNKSFASELFLRKNDILEACSKEIGTILRQLIIR